MRRYSELSPACLLMLALYVSSKFRARAINKFSENALKTTFGLISDPKMS